MKKAVYHKHIAYQYIDQIKKGSKGDYLILDYCYRNRISGTSTRIGR
jgi:hypothetical protein